MFGWLRRCRPYRHVDPCVVGVGVEMRGEVQLNNVRPCVRFYVKCRKCGLVGDRLRDVGKAAYRPDDLVMPVWWDTEDAS